MDITPEKITVKDLLELRKNGMLTVNPEYQRGAVWTEAQQKRLIDSVLRGYPLPLIYLHHKKKVIAGMQSEGLEIIDGQQRLNALYLFGEGGLKLFDPVKDDKQARFPNFVRELPCPWARLDFIGLASELKRKFLETELFIVKIQTAREDEARDLFIRLQAGLPLNAQEKRDAWPGGFTELVLRLGGKREIARYPGHDFFKHLVKLRSSDRGEVRQLCAQICMLIVERAALRGWASIGTQAIDDYYYRNLDFDISSDISRRISKAMDVAFQLFASQATPKMKGHEVIHILLLVDTLTQSYANGWQEKFMKAYDQFKHDTAKAKKLREGEYWYEYGALTQTQSAEARTIQRRHAFFASKMLPILEAVSLDENRNFGEVEREIVYYRYEKRCPVCAQEIRWQDLEIHHVEEHQSGGKTDVENAVPVHKDCHPKGKKAEEFFVKWRQRKESPIDSDALLRELDEVRADSA